MLRAKRLGGPFGIRQSAFSIAIRLTVLSVRRRLRHSKPMSGLPPRQLANSHRHNGLRAPFATRCGSGTPLAFCKPTREVIYMFAVAAILIGIVGILYVRRRSTRKKQQTV